MELLRKFSDSGKLLLEVAFSVISLKKEHEGRDFIVLVSALAFLQLLFWSYRVTSSVGFAGLLPLWPNQSRVKSSFNIPLD